VIWVCILCRKKQELLSKTGQWINKATIQQDGFIRRNEPDGSSDISQQAVVDPHDTLDKRPKLERTRSAAEKENLPLQRSGSMLKRQYSQQEQTTNQRDMMGPQMGMDIMSPGQRQRMQPMTPQQMQQQQQQQQQMSQQGQYRGQQSHYGGTGASSGHHQKEEDPRLYQQQQQHHPTHPHHYGGVGGSSQLSAAGQHAHQMPTPATSGAISSSNAAALASVSTSATSSQGYQKPPPIQRNLTISGGHAMDPSTYNARRHLNVSQYATQQQRSFSSYEDEIQQQQQHSQYTTTAASAGMHSTTAGGLSSYDLEATLRDDLAWRQQRSLNERDLLSVSSSYGPDYRLTSSNRLYSSADRDRYELHRERLEKYPLTRTARLDVQQRNTFNRTNHDRSSTAAAAAASSLYGPLGPSSKIRDIGSDILYGGVSARRAPPLAAAAQRSSAASSYLHKQQQQHPQIVIGDTPLSAKTSATSSASLYERYMGSSSGTSGVGGTAMTSSLSTTDGATRSLSRDRSLVDSYWDESAATPSSVLSSNKAQDSRRFTERRIKKTVRFDSHDIDNTASGADTGLHVGSTSLPPVTTILPSTAVEVGAATILTSAKLHNAQHSMSSSASSATNTATNLLNDTTTAASASTNANHWSRWDNERQGSQDSATKDSGIDTSSTFTSSEDSNRGDGPKTQHRYDWSQALLKQNQNYKICSNTEN
ncbi:rab-3-interacting molecule unc-10-like, partial [Musca vetustissima]|uniref:rab-3-interacting molecule unc-10-like n=1 Tax=Musca vetustissima TaxID=27455 RepID=UPI002AB73390